MRKLFKWVARVVAVLSGVFEALSDISKGFNYFINRKWRSERPQTAE